MARSRRTPAMLTLPTPLGAFQPPKPALGDPPRSFPGTENKTAFRTINPEFEESAQTWGWKMITVHEKDVPVTIKRVPQIRSCSRASVVEKLRAA